MSVDSAISVLSEYSKTVELIEKTAQKQLEEVIKDSTKVEEFKFKLNQKNKGRAPPVRINSGNKFVV